MTKKTKPTPTDLEIKLDPNKVIISKTDKKGVIKYANDYFIEISSYTKEELINKPHNIIRHPDMPKIVFKILWEKLHKGDNIYGVIKNLTKNGDYYWVVTRFETEYDENGNITTHTARRKAVPEKVKLIADSIYKTIVKIEKIDPDLAERSFYEILEKYNLTYDDFFLELANMNEQEIKDYFLSEEQNINDLNHELVFDIDTRNISTTTNNTEEKDINHDVFLNKIEFLKSQIEELKKAVNTNNASNNEENFNEKEIDKELKNLMDALKKKNH